MNKKLIIVLLVSFALLVTFSWVYARYSSEPEQTKGTTESQEVLKQVAETIKPPQIKIVKYEEVPTVEDLQRAATEHGKILLLGEEREVIDFDGSVARPLDWCYAEAADWSTGISAYVEDDYTWCWPNDYGGGVHFKALIDVEAFGPQCPAPQYPFEVHEIGMLFYVPDPCHIIARVDLEYVAWTDSGFCPWPGDIFYHSEDTYIDIPSYGWNYLAVAVDPPVCIYDRVIASFSILNDDDFDPTGGTLCPDYIYEFALSAAFDHAGKTCHSWWTYVDPVIAFMYWFDGVVDVGYPGTFAIWAGGYTEPQNDCEPIDWWYFKPPKFDTTEAGEVVSYAPNGMPDFHQYQLDFPDSGKAYCGPTALANCLWWYAAAGRIPPFWDGAGNPWTPDKADILISLLADCMGTGPDGTTPAQMDSCIEDLIEMYTLWITHEEVPMPTFEEIQYELRLCQDVILLLGFWYEDPPGSGNCLRIGGHWVTMAGVDHINWKMAISNPALNLNCAMPPPWGGKGIFIVPHVPPPEISHDDAGNVSHDRFPGYQVLPFSPSPGGVISLPFYEVYDFDLENFLGKNVPPEFADSQVSEVPDPLPEIITEVEYAKIICPAPKETWKDVYSSRVHMTFNNMGGFAAFDWTDYDDEVYSVGFRGTILLGTNAGDIADNYTEGYEDSYEPYMRWEQCSTFVEDWEFEWHHTKFYHNYGLSLDIDLYLIGAFDPEDGPCENAVIAKYLITNTGPDPITDIEKALYYDMDVGNAENNEVMGAPEFSTIWTYEVGFENLLFGMTQKPIYEGGGACGGFGASQPYWIYDNHGWDHDTLKAIMEANPWVLDSVSDMPIDVGHMLIDQKFSLDPGESYCNEYIIWAYDTDNPPEGAPTLGKFLYELLRQEGFYRGDVNGNGDCDMGDAIDIADYVLGTGPPPEPFPDQGDVNLTKNGDCDFADAIDIAIYSLGIGLPPTDYSRLQEDVCYWERLTLFGDPRWRDLTKKSCCQCEKNGKLYCSGLIRDPVSCVNFCVKKWKGEFKGYNTDPWDCNLKEGECYRTGPFKETSCCHCEKNGKLSCNDNFNLTSCTDFCQEVVEGDFKDWKRGWNCDPSTAECLGPPCCQCEVFGNLICRDDLPSSMLCGLFCQMLGGEMIGFYVGGTHHCDTTTGECVEDR